MPGIFQEIITLHFLQEELTFPFISPFQEHASVVQYYSIAICIVKHPVPFKYVILAVFLSKSRRSDLAGRAGKLF